MNTNKGNNINNSNSNNRDYDIIISNSNNNNYNNSVNLDIENEEEEHQQNKKSHKEFNKEDYEPIAKSSDITISKFYLSLLIVCMITFLNTFPAFLRLMFFVLKII